MKTKASQENNKLFKRPSVQGILAVLLALVMTFGCFPGVGWAAEDGDSYFFGKCVEYSTFNAESKDLKDSFYFSDSWFQKDPTERNDELALVSMQLTAAAVEGSLDSSGSKFLKDMGFSDIGFADNALQDPDSCNYTYGKKTMDGGRTLAAIVIQSFSEDSDVKQQGWKQNFIVNGDDSASGEHFAFARACDKVIGDIEALGDSNTVFWIMGQSRGGALSNLIAKRLGDSGRDVYAYTFEAPATVDKNAVSGDYGYIHNYLCRDDLVTKIPMWGMTRYGNTYELKTDETDEGIQEELAKICSEAAEEDVPDSEWMETDIVDYLSKRVPARADYSKKRTDSFKDLESGENVTVTYSYQGSLVSLMSVIFGGELTGAADVLLDNVEKLEPAVKALAEAVNRDGTKEAMPYYYEAAKQLHAVLDSASETPLSLSKQDMYAILNLIGPFAIDKDYEPIDDPASNVMGYMSPVINVAAGAGSMTYSHQFDTLIARLKTLAPAPEMKNIDIIIDVPEAGDDVSKAPGEVKEFFDVDSFKDAKDSPWISASASWDTGDKILQDDYMYYLDITLETVGHTVPEDILLKLNGELPVGGPFITYDEGTGVTRVTFEFQIGNPPELEVSFDTDGKAEAPEPMNVKRGTSLATKEKPELAEIVTVDGIKYKLKGWYDENGTAWDDVKVTEPMTMYAKWLVYVDYIDISFDIPSLGDKVSEATVPEDAPYFIKEQGVNDPEYNYVDEISMEGEYDLGLYIALKDPDNSVFALEVDEWDLTDYTGTMTMNGEEVEEPSYEGLYYGLAYVYDEDEKVIRADYYFPVTAEEPAEEAVYTVVKGGGQIWVKGSDLSAEFVVERSENDEETFGRFTGLKVDGETVSEDAYTAEQGSLILNVKPDYLETLSEGSHDLAIEFDDGTAEADFTVAGAEEQGEDQPEPSDGAEDKPEPSDGNEDQPVKTGDTSDIATPAILIALSMLALACLGRKKHSDR